MSAADATIRRWLLRAEGTAVMATAGALVAVAAIALLTAGFPAAASASLGVGVVVVFFALGAVIDAFAVRRADWSAGLAVLVSYALRMALIGLAGVALVNSGLLASQAWFGAGLGVATCVWVAGLFGGHLTGRWPVYDQEAA
ncbi:MAG: hypothetical protein FWF36_08465 [Propionibacteriaceae bacterium]|nr:hypothetical protein [Propionibacteriaceae bacterium]